MPGGGVQVLSFWQFPAICRFFSAITFCSSPSRALLVPRVSPVQRCGSSRLRDVWLGHRNSPAIFHNFSQLDSTLLDWTPPAPSPAY